MEKLEATPTPFGPGADTAWLSWLRVVAICGVIAIHTLGTNAAEPNAHHTMRGLVAIVLDLGSAYTVPVFVMVSGAMLLDPARFTTARDFLRKRALRLLPAVLFWNLAYYVFRELTTSHHLTLKSALGMALEGNLYKHLYFFWIVLGLSLITPILIPYIRESPRGTVIASGLCLCAVPALAVASKGLRQAQVGFDENAFTWWVPYLGFFVLGYGLRGVTLRGRWLLAAVAAAGAMAALTIWQWQNPAAARLNNYSPPSYYSVTGIVFALVVYVAFKGVVSPSGPLRVLCRPKAVRVGRLLGDATLGVFGLHFMVLVGARRLGLSGAENRLAGPAPTTHHELLLLLVVTLVTWMAVLILRRAPLLHRVL